jgi:hypothetical protein
MTEREDKLETRVIELERWQRVEETRTAVFGEQLKNMNSRFDKIDDELSEIKNATWKVVWVIGAAFIAAAVTWVINGGLSISG